MHIEIPFKYHNFDTIQYFFLSMSDNHFSNRIITCNNFISCFYFYNLIVQNVRSTLDSQMQGHMLNNSSLLR